MRKLCWRLDPFWLLARPEIKTCSSTSKCRLKRIAQGSDPDYEVGLDDNENLVLSFEYTGKAMKSVAMPTVPQASSTAFVPLIRPT